MSNYGKYRVPELRELIRGRNLNFDGATRKADLIAILEKNDLKQTIHPRSPAKKPPPLARAVTPTRTSPPPPGLVIVSQPPPAVKPVTPPKKPLSPQTSPFPSMVSNPAPALPPPPVVKPVTPPRKPSSPQTSSFPSMVSSPSPKLPPSPNLPVRSGKLQITLPPPPAHVRTVSPPKKPVPKTTVSALNPMPNRQFKTRPQAIMVITNSSSVNMDNFLKQPFDVGIKNLFYLLTNHVYTFDNTLVDYILKSPHSHTYPNALLQMMGFPDTNSHMTYEEQLQLLWLFYITATPVEVDINRAATLSAIDYEELQHILSVEGLKYKGPTDKASILFTILTGFKPLPLLYNPLDKYYNRYNGLSLMALNQPYNVAFLNEVLYQMTASTLSEPNPVRYVAFRDHPLALELYVSDVLITDEYKDIKGKIGMSQPIQVTVDPYRYFCDNFRYYERVMTRNPIIQIPPPDLSQIPMEHRFNIVSDYRDDELLDGYEILQWNDRPDLITQILAQYNTPVWSFKSQYCSDIHKENEYDPVLSYGLPRNYRCYLASELITVFNGIGQGFEFKNPKWKAGDIGGQVFTPASMKQLEGLIANYPTPILHELYSRVHQGLLIIYDIDRQISQLKRDFDNFPEHQRNLIATYLIWMFLTGMYMRYWEGRGHAFPHYWTVDAGERSGDDKIVRDNRVKIQFGQENIISTRMTPQTLEWTLNLPEIRYNFRYDTVNLEDRKIRDIINKINDCNLESCITESYPMIQTSYYLLTKLLSYNIDQFNELLRHQIEVKIQPPFSPK